MSNLILPSYKGGFARNAAESANPNLWKGLVGLWSPSLGPTGLTLFDHASRKNHGTLTNMDQATDWVVSGSPWNGYALNYDASNDRVVIQDAPALNISINISVGVWFKKALADDVRQFIAAKGTGIAGPTDDWWMEVQSDDTLRFAIHKAGGAGRVHSPTLSVADTDWHFGLGTYDGAVVRLFLDGVEAGSGTAFAGTMQNPGNVMVIGTVGVQDGLTWNGLIGSVALWSRIIVPSESRQLYEQPHAIIQPRSRIVVPAAAVAATIVVLRRRREAA